MPGQSRPEAEARLVAISELAPRAAVLEAWLLVEAAAADVIHRQNLGGIGAYPGPVRIREALKKGNLLSGRQVAIFDELRRLRNEAVHVPDAQFTKMAVSNYIEAAITMAVYLEQLASAA